MNTAFAIALLLLGLLGVLAAVLLWSRLAAAGQAVARSGLARPLALWQVLWRSSLALGNRVRALWGSRDPQPRVLLIGAPGSGKTSLLATLVAACVARAGPSPPARGSVPGAQLSSVFLQPPGAHGASPSGTAPTAWLVDPEPGVWMASAQAGQAAPAQAAEGSNTRAWRRLLRGVAGLRPARPLDAVVLVVSVRTLLLADATQRRELALAAAAQLQALQQELGWWLPVHVVLTQADALPGFVAHCQAVLAGPDSPELGQIFGWAAPAWLLPQATQTDPPPEHAAACVDAAFDALALQLQEQQLRAAARSPQLPRAVEAFLFPHQLAQLRAPLREVLALSLREPAWPAGGVLRSIGLTGALQPAPVQAARHDLVFAEQFFTAKVLAEIGLALPSRRQPWSPSGLMRGLRLGAAALLVVLAAGTVLAALQVRAQVDALRGTTEALAAPRAAPALASAAVPCAPRSQVQAALARVQELGAGVRSPWMPLSYVVQPPGPTLAQRVAEPELRHTLLPALSCALWSRVKAVATLRAPLETSKATADGEGSAAYAQLRADWFAKAAVARGASAAIDDYAIATRGPGTPEQRSQALGRLLYVLFEIDWQPSAWASRDLLVQALATRNDSAPGSSAAQLRAALDGVVSSELVDRITPLRAALLAQVAQGPVLLATLDRFAAKAPAVAPSPSLAAAVAGLTRWLAWLQGDWLPLDAARNPCVVDAQAQQQLLAPVVVLELEQAAQRCALAAQSQLAQMQFAPYGALVQGRGAQAVLQPAVGIEARGLQALADLGFMQSAALQPFACDAMATGWGATELAQGLAWAREYQQYQQRFAVPQPLPKALTALLPASAAAGQADARGATVSAPLYERVARAQLLRAMGDALQRAQTRAVVAGAGLAPSDVQLQQQSSDFVRSLPALFSTQQLMLQWDASGRGMQLMQCTRSQAQAALARIQGLADSSRLWLPDLGPPGQLRLDLGAPTVLADYLARQVSRAQVLAAYAEPYTRLLANSDAQNDGQPAVAQTQAYWARTGDELARYVQFNDSAGQIGGLNDLFQQGLMGLTPDNCVVRLSKGALTRVPAVPSAAPAASVAISLRQAAGNDLFSSQRATLLQQLRLSCTALAYSNYQALVQDFKDSIGNRYPFAPLSAADAPLAAVRAFLTRYAGQAGSLREALQASGDARAPAALAYLARLDAAAAFMQGADGSAQAGAHFTLGLQFRALPAAAPGSEQVVSWVLTVGPRLVEYPGLGTPPPQWALGAALALDLTWASASVWRPAPGAAGSDYKTDGARATFTGAGDYALLRWLEQRRPRLAPAADPQDERRALLEFNVPLQPAGPVGSRSVTSNVGTLPPSARFFLGLSLSVTDPKTQAAVSRVWPGPFPYPSAAP